MGERTHRRQLASSNGVVYGNGHEQQQQRGGKLGPEQLGVLHRQPEPLRIFHLDGHFDRLDPRLHGSHGGRGSPGKRNRHGNFGSRLDQDR